MSNDKRPNDFAARLQRIEDINKQPRPVLPPHVRKDLTYDNSGAPEDHRLRNGIIWSVIVAGMATGGYFAVQAVPPEMSASLASITSVFSSGSTMQSIDGSGVFDTDSQADAGMRGANVQSPAVASSLPDSLTLADLVTGFALPDDTTQIGRIIPFDRNDQCNLRRPLADEQVVNVRLENGALPVPVRAFSDTALVGQLARNVAAVTQDGRPYDWGAQVSGEMTGVDVFLTDTSAPIYLVLQNLGKGIVWNVQTAPGVTLAHVAIVSSEVSGLVSPPATTSFEALLVSDFVPQHEFGADDTVRACMIRPWREPQPDWGAVQRADGNALYSNQIHSFTMGYAAYDAWHTGTLGVDAGTNLIAPETAAHVLVGPIPAAPFAYQGMNGRDVHLMRTDHMISGDPVTLQAKIDSLHGALLRDAVGGDVALLDPAVVATAPAIPPEESVEPVTLPRDPLQYLRDRAALRDMFSTETLTPGRTVTVTENVAIADILATDEALPDRSRIPLYAAARAPMWMARHCEEVIADFGLACDVTATSVRPLDDDRIELSATLAYIPAAALGDPRDAGNAAFFTADVMLIDTARLLPPFDADNRSAAMRKAQAICDRLREEFGNCVVTDLQLLTEELWITDLERLPPGTNSQRLTASAKVTVYADQTWTDETQLHDIVQELASAD
jgi:hypothetical protein